ncbi:MAG: hypothetical protein AB1726_14055 [Planctomycetota bacterium]
MRLLPPSSRFLSGARGGSRAGRQRGAVLMLAMLVLFVLLLIVFQISVSTGTDARTNRNQTTLQAMDLAIESVLLQAFEDLANDTGASAGGAEGAAAPMGEMGGEGGEAGGEGAAPCDSREDGWFRPQTSELNGVKLRYFIQDEDSKFDLLTLLTANEDEAGKAFERLVRILGYARKGTEAEIEGPEARQMAQQILEFMNRRREQLLPRPVLLSDDEEHEDWGLPLSLREVVAIDPELFAADLFRDYEDEFGRVVHSLGSFLTVWTSLSTAGAGGAGAGGALPTGGAGTGAEAAAGTGTENGTGTATGTGTGETGESTTIVGDQGGTGGASGGVPGVGGLGGSSTTSATPGVAVNVNTAPLAVLKGLLDERDVPHDWWENVLDYRNTIDEEKAKELDPEYQELDEYGNPIGGPFLIFDGLDKLAEVDGWNEIEPIYQGELNNLLTVQSNVFSIFVTARKPTGEQQYELPENDAERREMERDAPGLVRTIRCVVWRREQSDGTFQIVPLQRWEELDYVPIEVKDYQEEDERR